MVDGLMMYPLMMDGWIDDEWNGWIDDEWNGWIDDRLMDDDEWM